MKLSKIIQDRYFIFLGACILVALLFTLRYLILHTAFGYDMARDAFNAYDIVFNHNLKILGPGTDIVGLNHGVLWYYFLAIPYFFARQDPQKAVVFFYLLAIFTIPSVWMLSFKLFKDRKISFVATILYSFSPLVVALSSWMSNPIPGLYTTPILLLLILNYSDKRSSKKAFFIGVLYGVLVQAQLANLILFITIPFFIFTLKIKLKIKDLLFFLAGIFLMLLSYLLVEFKFGSRGIFALLGYLKNGHGGHFPNTDFMVGKIIDYFEVAIFPFPRFIVVLIIILLLLGLIVKFKKAKKSLIFLLIWLSNILLFTLFDTGVSHSNFVFIPSIAVGIILVSFIIVKFLKSNILIAIILLLIVSMQIKTVNTWIADEISPATIQKSGTVLRYKEVVDYTYQSSGGKPFILNTVTNPLYINTTWAYLYEFYGKTKYGYEPFWGGRTQEGYPGNMVEKTFGERYRYLILESEIGMDKIYPVKAVYEEDRVGDLVDTKNFGYISVQKRIFHENKPKIKIPKILKKSPVLYE